MTTCHVQASGTVELYFYGELAPREREVLERHAASCIECRRALEELTVIRAALDARPDVSAPPGGDWSAFMARLEGAIETVGDAPADGDPSRPRFAPVRVPRRTARILAIAALLALVTLAGVAALRTRFASRDADRAVPAAARVADAQPTPAGDRPPEADAALTEVSEHHFTRSKLVVLGLATKNPADASGMDWAYERGLATTLLNDTRLYRRAAEERGLRSLADVMGDLELLLLQTSMSETPDAASLSQLQQLIRRRDLLTKMDAVTTAGL